ncbi:MAG: hypothetical protein QM769_12725 [Pseudoxanthomonas sp.]
MSTRRQAQQCPDRKDGVAMANSFLGVFSPRGRGQSVAQGRGGRRSLVLDIQFAPADSLFQNQRRRYDYADMNALASWTRWSHDSVDCFFVSLRLRDGDEVYLFSFMGDGPFRNSGPLPDWLYWGDFAFDMTGTQQRESLAYAELLKQMIGVNFA